MSKLNTIVLLLILVIVGVILFNLSKLKLQQNPTTVKSDTVWMHKDSTIYSKPQIIESIPIIIESKDTQYLPDTNYNRLVEQYNQLVRLHLDKKVFIDTLKIDSIGYVNVIDTISSNMFSGRSFNYNLKYPVVTKTVVLPNVTQFYIGGGLTGLGATTQLNAGFLLKDKKERIYGVTAGINTSGKLLYGVSSYWKISFKK
jgi:hypothetical protein